MEEQVTLHLAQEINCHQEKAMKALYLAIRDLVNH